MIAVSLQNESVWKVEKSALPALNHHLPCLTRRKTMQLSLASIHLKSLSVNCELVNTISDILKVDLSGAAFKCLSDWKSEKEISLSNHH